MSTDVQFDLLVRVAIALVLGTIFGLERLVTHHDAGVRTLGLVCAGCCLFTATGANLALGHNVDPTRIAAQVVTGVGFLGAGAIFHGGSRVLGLTTAATVWVVSAVGIACGFGLFPLAIGTTVLALAVLVVVKPIERLIVRAQARKEQGAAPAAGGDPAT